MLKVDATDRVHPRRFGDARFGSAVPGHGYLLFAVVVPLGIYGSRMILPLKPPLSMRRCASGADASGSRRAIGIAMSPAATSLTIRSRRGTIGMVGEESSESRTIPSDRLAWLTR